MTRIVLENLTKGFPGVEDQQYRTVVDHLSLQIEHDCFATLLGPNGCGKSVTLKMIAGMLQPDAGRVLIVPSHEGPVRVGFVWQDYRSSLLPWMDVADNISFGLRLRGESRRLRRSRAVSLLRRFSRVIDPHQKTYSLSGGQQQLVSILRSTIVEPDIWLADEPYSAIDTETSWTMAFEFERVWLERPTPVLFVSHDIDQAILLATDIMLMDGAGSIAHRLHNTLSRPRNAKMLTSPEHIRLRKAVFEFFMQQGAIGAEDKL